MRYHHLSLVLCRTQSGPNSLQHTELQDQLSSLGLVVQPHSSALLLMVVELNVLIKK